MTSLALSAFVASAASTLSLQSDILSACAPSDSYFLHSYLSTWSSQFGDIPDASETGILDCYGVQADKALVEATLNSSHSLASFFSCLLPTQW